MAVRSRQHISTSQAERWHPTLSVPLADIVLRQPPRDFSKASRRIFDDRLRIRDRVLGHTGKDTTFQSVGLMDLGHQFV